MMRSIVITAIERMTILHWINATNIRVSFTSDDMAHRQLNRTSYLVSAMWRRVSRSIFICLCIFRRRQVGFHSGSFSCLNFFRNVLFRYSKPLSYRRLQHLNISCTAFISFFFLWDHNGYMLADRVSISPRYIPIPHQSV